MSWDLHVDHLGREYKEFELSELGKLRELPERSYALILRPTKQKAFTTENEWKKEGWEMGAKNRLRRKRNNQKLLSKIGIFHL